MEATTGRRTSRGTPRARTLVALWLAFLVASVGGGFAAAGLVGSPFVELGANNAAIDEGSTTGGQVPGTGSTSEDDAAGTGATPSPSASGGSGGTGGTGGTGGSYDGGSGGSSSGTASADGTVKGGIATRGGYVSATCHGDLVSVGAAPAVYWRVKSRTAGQVENAQVRLEPAKDADGERVEVSAWCTSGKPKFHRTDTGSDDTAESSGSGSSGRSADDSGHGGDDDNSGSGHD